MDDLFTYNGKTQSLAAWAREYGIGETTLGQRLKCQGMTLDEALNKPVNKDHNRVLWEHDGRKQTLKQWAAEYGMCLATLQKRIHGRKWSIDKALNTPLCKKGVLWEVGGKSQTLKQWACEIGISLSTLEKRIYKHKWSIQNAIGQPARSKNTNNKAANRYVNKERYKELEREHNERILKKYFH